MKSKDLDDRFNCGLQFCALVLKYGIDLRNVSGIMSVIQGRSALLKGLVPKDRRVLPRFPAGALPFGPLPLLPGPPFVCHRCGRLYTHKCNLMRHLRLECGVGPRFECIWCAKKFKHRHHLRDHHRTHFHQSVAPPPVMITSASSPPPSTTGPATSSTNTATSITTTSPASIPPIRD
ncbi:hypothetical protein J437_LFUL015832 [Ladona fulva]|uniref:C2H2-type domain-containing protein n=1 Tax=Ladona fulva TaxID=123851 RepID=A0A8K0KK70_LADFU|nr:hypothetical protein J437_LFUL015832 [Ladona fulva]